MSDIREELYAKLAADGGIAALVGKRISPGWSPAGENRPAITYVMIDRPRETVLGGPSVMPHPRFQINCFGGKSQADAVAVAAAVRAFVDAFERGSWGDLEIESVRIVDERDNFEMPDDGSDRPECCVQLDVVIWFVEN